VQTGDTICAISSAVGAEARMIVRLSGPDALPIASQLTIDLIPQEPTARRMRFRIRSLEFPGWIYCFRAPRSATGEDIVELHIPGNPLLARMVLEEMIARGARHAGPGEFTARAYFNGKVDLAQAEGIAAVIAAHGDAELRAARQLMAGELTRRLSPVMDRIADTLALVEAGIDFSDEGISFINPEQIALQVRQIDDALAEIVTSSSRFERLSHEPQIVLVGRPNAGKSTLLNALAGQERAIVSEIAGTTRDALSSQVTLSRGIVRLIDVAGIDESEPTTEIDQHMRRRALDILQSADAVVLVRDRTDSRPDLSLPREVDLKVISKADQPTSSPGALGEDITVSSHTGAGMAALRAQLDELAFGSIAGKSLALNARHLGHIASAREALARAREAIESGAELVAADLREALDSVGAVSGQVTPDDVLGRVFATFCIGK